MAHLTTVSNIARMILVANIFSIVLHTKFAYSLIVAKKRESQVRESPFEKTRFQRTSPPLRLLSRHRLWIRQFHLRRPSQQLLSPHNSQPQRDLHATQQFHHQVPFKTWISFLFFCKIKKPQKTWISLFVSLKASKRWVAFLQVLKTTYVHQNTSFGKCSKYYKSPQNASWDFQKQTPTIIQP